VAKKKDTLAGLLVLWVEKWLYPKANQLQVKAIFLLIKAMQILPI
jgi:hypothetical protein